MIYYYIIHDQTLSLQNNLQVCPGEFPNCFVMQDEKGKLRFRVWIGKPAAFSLLGIRSCQ